MSYATPADLIARVDTQIVGDLITDDDPDTDDRVRPSQADILVSPLVQTALDDASGKVFSSLGKANRYTEAQLEGLTGIAAGHLRRITCNIAICYLFDRRADQRNSEMADKYAKKAADDLKQLATGENIFGLVDGTDVDAGLITTDGPTSIDLRNANRLDERMSARHLIDSGSRLPLDRG